MKKTRLSKRIFAVLLAVIMVLTVTPLPVLAEVKEGTGYSFDTDTGKLTITMDEGMDKYRNMGSGIDTRAVKSIEIGGEVTGIPEYGCQNLAKLESVVISEGLTDIGRGAFAYCFNLKEISIPSTVDSIDEGIFVGCSALTKITVPKGTVAVTANPSTAGKVSIKPTSLDTIAITATEGSGYEFENWEGSDSNIADSNSSSTTYTIPSGADVTLTANFKIETGSVTINMNKDGSKYNSHEEVTLRQSGISSYNGTGTNGEVKFTGVADGEYEVYVGENNTGRIIEINDDGVIETLNYYTIQFAVSDAGTAKDSTISATYDSANITSGDVVLGGKSLVITAVGAGADQYEYEWSGDGASGSSNSITKDNLAEKIDAQCVVTGTNDDETYSISSSPSTEYVFPSAVVGYNPVTVTSWPVTIKNTGTVATGQLNITLSGKDASCFKLATGNIISDIAVGGKATYYIGYNGGLTEGTYTATVIVSGDNGINETLNISLTVEADLKYSISLDPSTDYKFPNAVVGYDEQKALVVTVKNTGNAATGKLNIALSDQSVFVLSKEVITDISVGGTETFEIRPITGIPSTGGCTAAVTVSGDNGIEETFNVSFTIVKAADPTPSQTPDPTPVAEDVQKDVVSEEGAPAASLNNNLTELKTAVFTKEELALIQAGVTAKVYLEVKDIEGTVSQEDKSVVKNTMNTAAKNYIVGSYVDISLFKKVGNKEAEKITNPNGTVNISIAVPEELKNKDKNVTRNYKLVRIHNGVGTVISSSYDNATGMLTFETDEFSTYAIIYEDVSADIATELSKATISTKKQTLYAVTVKGTEDYVTNKTVKLAVTLPDTLKKVTAFSDASSSNEVKVTYKSSNTKVAKVSSAGTVTAVAKGTATITVTLTTATGETTSFKVAITVKNPSITFVKAPTTIANKKTATYTIKVDGYKSSAISWNTSKKDIAVIAKSKSGGKLSVKATGKTTGTDTVIVFVNGVKVKTTKVTVK
ncbi:leucine-rich repeat protein [Anaerosporobacter sp.]|uniref:leucine-rich repeat protein n=1 Tax=Anaerosporobacter sp. TaxID=1872529 RepID=UPI00286F9AA4|nr:leucine-rich repeat protein [Anaerosporobacter sp.]